MRENIAVAAVIHGSDRAGEVRALVNGLALREIQKNEDARRAEIERRDDRIKLLESRRRALYGECLKKYEVSPLTRLQRLLRPLRTCFEILMAYTVILGFVVDERAEGYDA